MIEVQDRDSEMKQKGVDYANVRRRAQRSDIQSGIRYWLKRRKLTNCLQRSTKCQWKLRKSKDVAVKSSMGSQYRRNVTHLKKFEDGPSEVEESVQENENQVE